MKDKKLVIIILFASLGLLLIVYFALNTRETKRYQWRESYQTGSEQPYGTKFIRSLLATYRPGTKFTVNEKLPLHKLLDTANVKADYVFIAQEIYLDDTDRDALLNFIAAGNDAFIATVHLPFNVIDPVFTSQCDKRAFLIENKVLSAKMNFYNHLLESENGYNYSYRFGKDDVPYYWNYLNPEVFCDSTTFITPLAYIDPDKVNFFKLPHGKGNLYVHTNPLVFTNYFLTKADKAEYASSVFSHLDGDAILWDEFSKSQFLQKNKGPEVNPIAYILQQDSLRYAWWLMLASAILYTLFTAKRKQRVIPVLEEKINTSLEFISTISALHFENGNDQNIARKKAKYFYYFIRSRYNIQTQSLTEIQIKKLAEKSKVDLSHLEVIGRELNYLERQHYYSASKLIDLYNALDHFYKNCK